MAGLTVSAEDTGWITALAEEYGLPHVGLDVLKRHVDIVPPSLALAQSAEESGWGTSRFAIKGNALFGQRIYRGDKGMVPLRRDPDKQHRVRQFDHPQESVSRYLHNLNTHWAYDMFRDLARGCDPKISDSIVASWSAHSPNIPSAVPPI